MSAAQDPATAPLLLTAPFASPAPSGRHRGGTHAMAGGASKTVDVLPVGATGALGPRIARALREVAAGRVRYAA